MAGQSDRCEIVISNKILSLGFKLGYNTIDEIMEEFENEL